MSSRIVHACILICILLGSLPTSAEPLVVAVEDIDFMPLWSVENGTYKGFGRELLDAFAEHEKLEIEYRPLPVKRLFLEFLSGRVDLKFPDHPNWAAHDKAGKNLRYSDPILDYVDGLLVRPEYAGRLDRKFEFIGTVRGFTLSQDLQDSIGQGQGLVEATEIGDLIRMAMAKRIQAVYFNVAVGQYYLREQMKQANALVFDASRAHTRGQYYLSSIKRHDVVQAFNRFMREEKALIDTLRKRYHLQVEAEK